MRTCRPRWEVSKVRLFKTSLLSIIQCCQKIRSAWKVAKPHLSNVLNNFLKALTPGQLDPNDRNCVTVAQSPLYCPPIGDERKFPCCSWPADITTTLISASLLVRGRGCREAVVQDWGLGMTGVSLQCFTFLSVGEEKQLILMGFGTQGSCWSCPVLIPSCKPAHQRSEAMGSSQQGHWVDQLLPFFVHKAASDRVCYVFNKKESRNMK